MTVAELVDLTVRRQRAAPVFPSFVAVDAAPADVVHARRLARQAVQARRDGDDAALATGLAEMRDESESFVELVVVALAGLCALMVWKFDDTELLALHADLDEGGKL